MNMADTVVQVAIVKSLQLLVSALEVIFSLTQRCGAILLTLVSV